MQIIILLLLIVGELVLAQNNTIVYSDEGNFNFSSGSYTLELCGNDTAINYRTLCDELDFLNATVNLEVRNDFGDIFFIDQDWTDYYIERYNKTITDDDDIEINSFNLTYVTYSYIAYYVPRSPSPSPPYHPPPHDSTSFDSGTLSALGIGIIIITSVFIVSVFVVVTVDCCRNNQRCHSCGISCVDKIKDFKERIF